MSRTMRFSTAARALAGQAGVLFGWTPAIFWAATPDELAAVIGALQGETPVPPDLSALMERFPDE
jgi:uncharacterized phage protein (TIGR02216 family)